jgi:thiol-disulfide isomerase/thioredoxin
MNRTGRIVLALALAQAALVGVFWWVEHGRSASHESNPELGIAPPVRLNGRMQGLSLTGRDGEPFEWTAPERPTLVHFWATWCPPCRTELPGILALSTAYSVDVVAVALDPEWADVDRFFAGRPPPNVFLGDSTQAEAGFDVHTLPVTFFVEAGGEIRLRFDGARDWTDARFSSTWVTQP